MAAELNEKNQMLIDAGLLDQGMPDQPNQNNQPNVIGNEDDEDDDVEVNGQGQSDAVMADNPKRMPGRYKRYNPERAGQSAKGQDVPSPPTQNPSLPNSIINQFLLFLYDFETWGIFMLESPSNSGVI